MHKISAKHLPNLFARIAGEMELYLPVQQDNVVNYAPWQPSAHVDLDTLKTVTSPKQLFLPSSEELYSATSAGGEISISLPPHQNSPFAIFGVKACDAKGIEILDSVYLSQPVDKFYESRRSSATIITLACNKPNMTCFCKHLV